MINAWVKKYYNAYYKDGDNEKVCNIITEIVEEFQKNYLLYVQCDHTEEEVEKGSKLYLGTLTEQVIESCFELIKKLNGLDK